MKRLGLFLSGCLLLAGCAHENADYAGGPVTTGAYPYAGLTDCSGFVYGYDPYDPYLYSSGFGGLCGGYGYRYYGYPYSSNYYGQARQRQRVTTVKRSSHPRAVAPRSSPGSAAESSFSSSASSSARAPIAPASSSPPATHAVSARR
jgi:hypothetical protein